MAKKPTSFDQMINEKSTAEYSAVLKDEAGTVIGSGDITTLTLTFSTVPDGAIINSRNAQNVLNLNNVTVDGSGNLKWILQPLDTAMQDPTKDSELHRATFQMTFNGGAGAMNWDVDFRIRNLEKVV